MTKFFLLLLLISPFADCAAVSWRLNSATTNITGSFNTTVKFTVGKIKFLRTLIVDNRTATEIAVNCNTGEATPSDSASDNIYVNASQGIALDNLNTTANVCYIRSMGSTISTGIVSLTAVTGY